MVLQCLPGTPCESPLRLPNVAEGAATPRPYRSAVYDRFYDVLLAYPDASMNSSGQYVLSKTISLIRTRTSA